MLKPSRHIKVKCYYTFTQHCCHSGSCREDMRINECTVKNNFTTFDKNHVLTVDGLKMQWVYMCFFTTRCPTATCSESLQRCCWMKSPRAQIYWPIQHMDTNVKLIQQRVKAWIHYITLQRNAEDLMCNTRSQVPEPPLFRKCVCWKWVLTLL